MLALAVHHPWWLAGAVAAAGVAAFALRGRLRRWLRLAKAAATDKRLPRPVRWVFVVALAVRCLPVDFGVDEVLLLVGVGLLAGPYRATWREVRADVDRDATEREGGR